MLILCALTGFWLLLLLYNDNNEDCTACIDVLRCWDLSQQVPIAMLCVSNLSCGHRLTSRDTQVRLSVQRIIRGTSSRWCKRDDQTWTSQNATTCFAYHDDATQLIPSKYCFTCTNCNKTQTSASIRSDHSTAKRQRPCIAVPIHDGFCCCLY
jgi:hypothetical protein